MLWKLDRYWREESWANPKYMEMKGVYFRGWMRYLFEVVNDWAKDYITKEYIIIDYFG